jgi:hypothetical protein
MWDTSVIPTALEKSMICHLVVKTDQNQINMLKMACFMFDKMYPDGPKRVVNIVAFPHVRNHSQQSRVLVSVSRASTNVAT